MVWCEHSVFMIIQNSITPMTSRYWLALLALHGMEYPAPNVMCSGTPNAFQHATSTSMGVTVRIVIYTATHASLTQFLLAFPAILPLISSTQVLLSVKKYAVMVKSLGPILVMMAILLTETAVMTSAK